jgi:hypothetical protein
MGREIVDHSSVVDFVFSGPSLRSFPELVRCLMAGDLEARAGWPGTDGAGRPPGTVRHPS